MRFAAKVQHPSCWQLHGGRGLGQAVETLRLLIDAKADLNARRMDNNITKRWETVLSCAVWQQKYEAISFLESFGASM